MSELLSLPKVLDGAVPFAGGATPTIPSMVGYFWSGNKIVQGAVSRYGNLIPIHKLTILISLMVSPILLTILFGNPRDLN